MNCKNLLKLGYECEEQVGNWFSKYLNTKTKMVKFVDGLKQCKSRLLQFNIDLDNNVWYQDLFPILIINQSSIDDLNQRINGKFVASYSNFRPNIVVEYAGAYQEDQWKIIRINDIDFNFAKPCDRCTMVCVDRNTGQKSANGEPLETLKTYRISEKWNKTAPLFGSNFVPAKNGKIWRHNCIEIIEINSK